MLRKPSSRFKTGTKARYRMQRHVHEFEGSTKLAEEGNDRHNHRFAGVTGQAIRSGSSHVHEIVLNRTDFFDHFHKLVKIRTGPAIPVGNGKHVHFVSGRTTVVDAHRHQFNFATLIDSPLT
ncbi:YmaF family protein [Paenibacillus sp. UNC496MF]|uniref:YmaF family protein n=1 Tax=Paenibacillus sp. UNC496MF TaxID=1502753 RepID=UPI0008E0BF77|nr:YmaF family protein [Paenibacillus sp. UNC496MF]SFI35669.1 YmaF family protein [Paenibacillus sp. UNC496MF]